LTTEPHSIVIAIDGPAASGKSTLAIRLTEVLGYLYFDTGVMYRVATLAALNELGSVTDEKAVTAIAERILIDVLPPSIQDGRTMDVLLDGKDVTWEIRSPRIDQNVSPVSAYPGVRAAMTSQQRRIGERGNTIMVGRDIGTVVFPQAQYKIYLDASAEERAHRRYLETRERGGTVTFEETLESIKRRDAIDSSRECAPLRSALDAYILDSDNKTVDEVVQEALDFIRAKSKNVG
jgi:cytidylate kinase